MGWMTKPLVLAAIAALQFNAGSNAKPLVFAIQDSQLILPLETSMPGVGTTGTCSTPLTAVTGSQSGVKVIEIDRDGKTCPEGTMEAANVNSICSYGSYEGNRGVSGNVKCCFVPVQNIFLVSRTGGEKNLKAKYTFDSRTCCPAEEGTALIKDQCRYGKAALHVPTDYVSKCCWNTTTQAFDVHLKQFEPNFVIPDAKYNTTGHARNGFCNLGYKVEVKEVRVWGNRMELKVFVNIDCATYNHTASTILTIFYDRYHHDSGRLTYVLDDTFGPTIYVDLSSQVSDDYSVKVHGRITGTGILGRLEEGFDQRIDDATMKALLKAFPLC